MKVMDTRKKLDDFLLKKSVFFGLMFAMFSGLAFTVSNFLVQVAIQVNTDRHLPTMEIVFCRTAVQLILIVLIAVIKQTKLCVSKEDILSVVIMGLTGYFSIVLIFLSLDKIPLSDTLVITFTSPFFCIIFSKLLLKENVHWLDVFCGILSFLGVIVVARPTFLFGETSTKVVLFQNHRLSYSRKEFIYFTGVLFGLSGGICLALYFVFIRKLSTKSNWLLTIFYPSLFGTILSPLSMPINQQLFVIPQSYFTTLALCSIGATSFLALTCLSFALKFETPTTVSLIRNLDIVYAFLLQYLVFNIKPTIWNISGGLIIVIATSLMSIRKSNFIKSCFYKNKLNSNKESTLNVNRDLSNLTEATELLPD